jgi:hypothetical protein
MASYSDSLLESKPREIVSPELALVDPVLAQRLRERDVSRALEAASSAAWSEADMWSQAHVLQLNDLALPAAAAAVVVPVTGTHLPRPVSPVPVAPISLPVVAPAAPEAAVAALRPPARRRDRRAIVSLVLAGLVLGSGLQLLATGSGERTAAAMMDRSSAKGASTRAQPSMIGLPPTGAATTVKAASSLPRSAAGQSRPHRSSPILSMGSTGAQESRPRAASAATTSIRPIRLAWVPAAGAVAYRVELFWRAHRILAARTTRPAFTLQPRWRYGGTAKWLEPGMYRWYVWPVDKAGDQAASAIVRSTLRVARS